MKTQKFPVGSDLKPEVVQNNLLDLYGYSHDHPVRSSAPSEKEGSVGDIVASVEGASFYIYVKFSSGWKKAALT